LVGQVGGSEVSYNVLSGSGPSALDTIRSDGRVSRPGNNAGGWHDTTPWYHMFKRLLQPMNAIWSVLFALIIVSGIRGRRAGDVSGHPYAEQLLRPGSGRVNAPLPLAFENPALPVHAAAPPPVAARHPVNTR
jgi:hypothetical protein